MNDDRRMELEIEVPGTPEEVWEAIATGPGITSWLHPTEVEEREGGELSFDMGGDMQFTGRAALDVLRAYLTHFPRRRGSWMRAFGQGEGSLDEVWSELTAALGVDGSAAGEPVTVGEGPSLTGVVEREAGARTCATCSSASRTPGRAWPRSGCSASAASWPCRPPVRRRGRRSWPSASSRPGRPGSKSASRREPGRASIDAIGGSRRVKR